MPLLSRDWVPPRLFATARSIRRMSRPGAAVGADSKQVTANGNDGVTHDR
jgi:hypothetical protein